MTDREAKQATPHDLLIQELLDSRIPKTEREHAAAREITAPRVRLAEPDLCESNDSPWLICKPCAAEGKCRLAQADEPVGWIPKRGLESLTVGSGPIGVWPFRHQLGDDAVPLYASPPPRQELSEEEVDKWAKELLMTLSLIDGVTPGLQGYVAKRDAIVKALRAIE